MSKWQQGVSTTFYDPKAETMIHQVHAMTKMNKNEHITKQ